METFIVLLEMVVSQQKESIVIKMERRNYLKKLKLPKDELHIVRIMVVKLTHIFG